MVRKAHDGQAGDLHNLSVRAKAALSTSSIPDMETQCQNLLSLRRNHSAKIRERKAKDN